MADQIDTTNYYMVSVMGEKIVMLNLPPPRMSKSKALGLAAWLVALADDNGQFAKVLEAVQST